MLPTTIKIGAVPFAVNTDDHEQSNWGHIDYTTQTIKIASRLAPHSAAQTLMHEIIHGIEVHFEGNSGEHDESKIQRLGNAILLVLIDNPDLCRMIETLRPV